MQMTEDGLIIKEEKIGEADRIVTVLLREGGVIRAFVTGARKLKSSKISSTSLFSYSRFTINKSKDTYRITEATPLESFFALRQDIKVTALASYFCDIAIHLAPAGEEGEEFLRLMLNCFHFLCEGKRDIRLLKAIFEFRAICMAGYMPDLSNCYSCGAEDLSDGSIDLSGDCYCKDCASFHRSTMPMNGSIFKALCIIAYGTQKDIFGFKMSDENIRYMGKITEKYIVYQHEYKFKTLDFYKSLENLG